MNLVLYYADKIGIISLCLMDVAHGGFDAFFRITEYGFGGATQLLCYFFNVFNLSLPLNQGKREK